jgi:hypothetical protein
MLRRAFECIAISALLGMVLVGSAHAAGAPELDPGTAGSGLALLVGGALLILERYRCK